MPRQPDPDLEERILKAAHTLWMRGGEKSLTMRAVARAAQTNTPAVYRRFKDRRDLLRGLLQRIALQIREHFLRAHTIEGMAEAYVERALAIPHEYELFYSHAYALTTGKGGARVMEIRDARPNFRFLENLLAERFGGKVEDHTQLALEIWSLLHGTVMLLLQKAVPAGHEEEVRQACRDGLKSLLEACERKLQEASPA